MKKIFLFISLVVSIAGAAQLPSYPGYTNINSKNQYIGVIANQRLSPPSDTTTQKFGFAIIPGSGTWFGNGSWWTALASGSSALYTSSQSVLKTGNNFTLVNDSTTLTSAKIYAFQDGTRGWKRPLISVATGLLPGDQATYLDDYTITNTHTVATYADGIVTGCVVSYQGNLVYRVNSPCVYNINGTQYTLPATTDVTLPNGTASAGEFRTDAIVVTTSSTATSVLGDNSISGVGESAQPDPATQFLLSYVRIDEANTTPTGVGQTIVRDEGSGGEWAIIKTMVSTDNYATNPFHLTISQRITTAANNSFMMWDGPTVSKASFNTLLLYMRNNAALANARVLQVRLFNGATQVGNTLSLSTYGYSKSTINTYQTVAVPMSAFAGTDAFNRIRITNTGTGGTVDFQIDYVQLQSGIVTGPPAATKQVFFNSVASLRAYTGTTDIQAITQGYYAANDGGGAAYYWDGTSVAADDGGLIIKATAVATGRWKLIFDRWVNVLWFGAKGDNSTDDRAKFVQALAALPQVTIASGQTSRGTLYAPFRTYYLSDSLLISDQINFIGGSLAAGLFGTTRMEFASGKSGVVLQMGNPSGGSRGSAMKNFYLYCRGGSDTTRHGLRFNGVSDIEYVTAENFGGNGIYANTTADGNNSGSSIINCKALNNGLDGIRIDGGETSAVFVLNPITQTNGRINIHDNGFLGSNVYGGQAAIAGQRPGFTSDSWSSSGGRYYVCKRNHTNKQPNVASDWTDYWEDMGTTTEIPASVAAWSGATPYKIAANYASTGAAQAAKVDGLYRETGSGSDVITSATSMNIGGVQASMFKHIGPSLTARDGYFDVNSGAGLQVRDTLNPDFYSRLTTEFGFEVGNKSTADESLAYKIQLRAFSDSTIKLFSGNSLVEKQLWTGRPIIGTKYGRTGNIEAGLPIFTKRGLFFMDIVGSASYTSSTRIRMFAGGTSYPIAEGINYGVGDIVINTNMLANDTLLWFCNTATPGGIWAHWTPVLKSSGGGGGGGTPGGSSGDVQWNSSGVLAGGGPTWNGTDVLSITGTDLRSNNGNWYRISATAGTTQFFQSGTTSLVDIYDGGGTNTLHLDYNHITASAPLTVNFFNSNIHTTGSGASTELVATDGASNNTTISPHVRGLLPYKLKKLGWTFNSTDITGSQITVDMLKAVETIEKQDKKIKEQDEKIYRLEKLVSILLEKNGIDPQSLALPAYAKEKPVKVIYKKLVK